MSTPKLFRRLEHGLNCFGLVGEQAGLVPGGVFTVPNLLACIFLMAMGSCCLLAEVDEPSCQLWLRAVVLRSQRLSEVESARCRSGLLWQTLRTAGCPRARVTITLLEKPVLERHRAATHLFAEFNGTWHLFDERMESCLRKRFPLFCT